MKRMLTVSILILAALSLRAQNVIDLIISEVMVDNTASITDDFGERTSWIEVFNTSQGTVNIAGCYFTDDPSNLTKSQIVKGDLRTKIGPRQVALFFADGQPLGEGLRGMRAHIRRGPGDILLLDRSARSFYESVSRVFYGNTKR